jgi:hypothetical protein
MWLSALIAGMGIFRLLIQSASCDRVRKGYLDEPHLHSIHTSPSARAG